jgi:hydroxymethylpyrimidine/phosphomethylpyrimidine kinase
VQNTNGVMGFEALTPKIVGDQIRAVAADIGVDAAKTGMLANRGIVEAIADAVAEMRIPNLVVDPVLVSKHGHPLLAEDAVEALKTRIIPQAVLVTPNLSEASALAGVPVEGREDMRRAADAIVLLGATAVLVKGGHLKRSTEAADLLVGDGIEEWVEAEWIDTPNTHGTGCTLSAAITSHLARGEGLVDAVRAGKAFVTEAIRHSLAIGDGIGPVDQLWSIQPGSAE